MIPATRLRALYATQTLREIASAHDTNWSTVRDWCVKQGIQLRKPGIRPGAPAAGTIAVPLCDAEREVVLLALHVLSTTGGYDRAAWASAYAKMGGK